VTTITIRRDALGDFLVFFQSRDRDAFADLISSLKCALPPGFRTYRPAERCWQVDGYAKADLDEWLREVQSEMPAVKVMWVEASGAKEERQRQNQWPPAGYRTGPTREELYARLWLLPGAPPEVVRAAYKTLAQLHHPDKENGDEEAMKLLNEAYAKLAA